MQGSHRRYENDFNIRVLFSNTFRDGEEASKMAQANAVRWKEHHAAFGILNGPAAVYLMRWPPAKTL